MAFAVRELYVFALSSDSAVAVGGAVGEAVVGVCGLAERLALLLPLVLAAFGPAMLNDAAS